MDFVDTLKDRKWWVVFKIIAEKIREKLAFLCWWNIFVIHKLITEDLHFHLIFIFEYSTFDVTLKIFLLFLCYLYLYERLHFYYIHVHIYIYNINFILKKVENCLSSNPYIRHNFFIVISRSNVHKIGYPNK